MSTVRAPCYLIELDSNMSRRVIPTDDLTRLSSAMGGTVGGNGGLTRNLCADDSAA